MVENHCLKKGTKRFAEVWALAFAWGGIHGHAASKIQAEPKVVTGNAGATEKAGASSKPSTKASVTAKRKELERTPLNQEAARKLLDAGTVVYEDYLEKGGASAVNQIATNYYVLAESEKDSAINVDYYKRAAYFFEQAADAGCFEARYNAGLVRSKLQEYEATVKHYRLCCKTPLAKDNVSIILKAALNWVVLIVEGNDHPTPEDVKLLMEVSQGYRAKFPEDKTQEDADNTKRAMDIVASMTVYLRNFVEQDKTAEAQKALAGTELTQQPQPKQK